MVETSMRNCPRCGEAAQEEWSYCPHCSLVLSTAPESGATLSNRIKYVQHGTDSRRRRNAIIQSLANLSIGAAILLMLGGGILLFHPNMVPSLFRPELTFDPPEITRVVQPEVPVGTPRYRVANEWIPVPGGSFLYGPQRDPEEITLEPFEIQRYEVTNYQWEQYLESERDRLETEGRLAESVPKLWGEWDPDSGRWPTAPSDLYDLPVVNITWYQAQDYCVIYLANQPGCEGARLPTPWEWVKAARGDEDARIYPWGDEFYQEGPEGQTIIRCNSYRSGGGGPTYEDFYKYLDVSPWGVVNMAGNVSEFVGVPTQGSLAYRGGCYLDDAFDCRIDVPMTSLAPGATHRWDFVGFRAARSVESTPEDGE